MMPGIPASGLDFPVKGSALAASHSSDQTTMAQPAENTQPIVARIEASAHSSDSSLREQALGHLFLGQLLTFMWCNGRRDIEVLKSEGGRGGNDAVREADPIVRHVHLKSSLHGPKSPTASPRATRLGRARR